MHEIVIFLLSIKITFQYDMHSKSSLWLADTHILLQLQATMIEKPTSRAPFAGHPAYDESTRYYTPSPRPGARVKPEGQEYAER